MNKIIYVFALSCLIFNNVSAATTSSIVNLSSGGSVAPASSFNLALTGLVPTATYSVVCYIDTNNPFQYVMLSSNLSDPRSNVISYSLNGNYVSQDQLQYGQNLVVINGSFYNPAADNLIFTNLDNDYSFEISSCFGIPIQVPSNESQH